jgi:hypothetical protein
VFSTLWRVATPQPCEIVQVNIDMKMATGDAPIEMDADRAIIKLPALAEGQSSWTDSRPCPNAAKVTEVD